MAQKESVVPGATITLPLEVGPTNETVTVTAAQEAEPYQFIINTRQVVSLPLGGRKPVELAGLQGRYRLAETTYDVRP